MRVRKSAEAIVAAGTGRRAERGRTRVGERFLIKPTKTEAHRADGAQAEDSGRYPEGAGLCVEVESAGVERTKAEWAYESELMEVVCERDNLWFAYERVVRNKGADGVDGIGVSEFKAHLQQHWPTIKAKLLAGTYLPQAVRRVDIPKPQGGTRTLGIPTLTDRLIQQALHQVLSPVFEADFSESSYGFRPGRNAHQAVKAARQYVAEGRRVVGGHGSGEVLRPGQSRHPDGEVGEEDRGWASAEADPTVSGSRDDGRGRGQSEDAGYTARRSAQSAAVEHSADGTGSGTGTPGSCVLPLCGRL